MTKIEINGTTYTQGQIEAALRCSDWVMTAYSRADEDNGGGGAVSWEEIDHAHEAAGEAFNEDALKGFKDQAKVFNGVAPRSTKSRPR